MDRVSAELVNKAAATVVSILQRLGYSCALSGDFVCHHFGFERKPRQVDVVVFSRNPPSLETLKLQVSQQSPKQFFTSWAGKTKVFYFCDLELKTKDPKSCIVSISYLDCTLHIKSTKNGLPLVPISYTILQKLEDWAEPLTENLPRQNSPDLDVQMLLKVVKTMSAEALATESLPPLLWDLSRHKILRFISEYQGYASAWEKLGFMITLRVSKAVTPPPVQRPKSPTIVRSPEVLIEAEGPDIPPIENPTRTQMVMMAARDSIRLLARCGWRSALFGSLACFLYGNIRVPNDVDLLVIPPEACTALVNAEDLKQNLLSLDPYHFYVTTPKDPTASYRILWYRLTDDPTQTVQTSCKVDILLPGVMHLPNIQPSLIHWDEGFPLIPFSLLLLQKLQAWDDHRHSKDPVKWQRQRTDMEDLKNLFELSVFHPLKESLPWTDAKLFSLEFQRLTKERVVAYVNAFPDSAPAWISIGF
ncbi:hypothetical protein H0H93_010255 [Arthromyces matolae]|nr:hypothetical protein H0H93_010255 [Arthromyces matolae]